MKSLDVEKKPKPVAISWDELVAAEAPGWTKIDDDEEHWQDEATQPYVLELEGYYKKHGNVLGYSDSDLPFVIVLDGVKKVRPHRWASLQAAQFEDLKSELNVEYVTLTRTIAEEPLKSPSYHAQPRRCENFTARAQVIVPRSKVAELEKEGWRV